MTALLRAVPRHAGSAPILAQPVFYYGAGDPISELVPHDLAAHRQQYGHRPACRPGAGVDVIEAIDEANLTGRGGAHLPSAIKWRAVHAAATQGRRPVVVANGAEGEPLSRKDATLLQLRPHLVFDGLACAAEALGADRAVIWLHDGAHAVRSAVAVALAERTAQLNEPLIEIAVGPDAYLSGESGAVVRALSGGPALPAFRTVSSAVRGVRGAPTLVHNVETLVHVAQLARGTAPTSALVTVCVGDARIVLEAQTDEVVQDVINRVVGAGVSAVLLGGCGGTWCSWPDLERLCLAEPEMRARRLSLGAGVLEVLRPGSCGLARAAEIAEYLAGQSARQCGPCLFGLRSVADAMAAVARGGRRSARHVLDLATYAGEIRGRGACHLPDGAVRMVTSALDVFADDVEAHRRGRCMASGAWA